MIKTILLIVTTLCISISAFAQSFNTEITENGKPILLGKINKEALSNGTYGEWFATNYEAFTPDETIINQLKPTLKGITITAFMGTWCGDSKRDVPKFYKILEETNFPLERMTLVGVSRERDTYKQSPGGEEEGLAIHRVPTFIFYKDGKEINRIVENPVVSLENDMLALLNDNYTNSYPVVDFIAEILSEWDIDKFNKKLKNIAEKTAPLVHEKWDLNTYAYVLMTSGKEEESIAVAKLNTLLFPEDAYVYSSLGAKYLKIGKTDLANKAFKKALSIDPEDKTALKYSEAK